MQGTASPSAERADSPEAVDLELPVGAPADWSIAYLSGAPAAHEPLTLEPLTQRDENGFCAAAGCHGPRAPHDEEVNPDGCTCYARGVLLDAVAPRPR